LWIKGEYYDALDTVETVSRGALSRAAQPCPFHRLDWLRLVAEHREAGTRPLIVRARSEGTDAWLFLLQQPGGRLAALANPHSQAVAPIFSGPAEPLHRRRLLRAIAGRLRRPGLGVARIALPAVAAEDADLLARAFRRAGWLVARRPAPPLWQVDTQGLSFDDYWETRPPALRDRIERAAGTAPLDLEVADRFAAPLWAELAALDDGADGFLRAFAERESAAGCLRLAVARLGHEPVAAQLWTVDRGIATAHRLAQAPGRRALSPGAQLSATMFRYLLNVDHVERIDYGPGGDRWKADWAETRLARQRLDLFNPRRVRAWGPALAAAASGLVRRRPLH